jgi:hypothetical protein
MQRPCDIIVTIKNEERRGLEWFIVTEYKNGGTNENG